MSTSGLGPLDFFVLLAVESVDFLLGGIVMEKDEYEK
jgi:hypothetical protein